LQVQRLNAALCAIDDALLAGRRPRRGSTAEVIEKLDRSHLGAATIAPEASIRPRSQRPCR
jgi:hypothetical protein